MKTLKQHLVQYAAYHRDGRNIATHLVGIPMIVCAVAALLSRVTVPWGDSSWPVSVLFLLGFGAFYLALDWGLGVVMGLLLLGVYHVGVWAAAQSTPLWLALGAGGFVVGWVIQFTGHWFEGRKPAFADDLASLAVGPLFVVAEVMFWLGLMPRLRAKIEAQFGAKA